MASTIHSTDAPIEQEPERPPAAPAANAPRRRFRWLKKIALALFVMVAVFLGFVAMQPSEFRISRTATMSAPPAAVFAQVNDFHNWEAWSPWAKLDPNSKVTFEGPPAGTGAIFTWAGNDQVGEGRMTLIESRPQKLIRIKLEFFKPFEGTNLTEFTFRTDDDQTTVTWTMTGRNNFIGRVFCLLMNMDQSVGGQFDQGLASIKKIVEKQ